MGYVYAPPWPEILFGALLCYAGFPLFQASVLAFGFLAGGGMGLLAASYLGFSGLVSFGSVLIGGCAGMFLFKVFVRGGFVLVGSALGLELGRLIAPHLSLVVVGCAIIGAVICLAASRRIIITITTVIGAAMLIRGGQNVLNQPAGDSMINGLHTVLYLFFVITGIMVQGWLTRRD